MEYPRTSYINGKTIVLGNTSVNDTEQIDIISSNGTNIKINGVVPSAGGGLPPVGDIDFIGNLNCNDTAGGGSKGIITAQKKINSGLGGIESTGDIKTLAGGDLKSGRDFYFNGQDIYKTYEGIEPQPANKTYKDYKGLIAEADNNTFTGTNKFRNNAVTIQALNTDVPAVYEDKISLNTDGNINCNEINNNTLLKSNSIICENGSPESQKVMARQYHFRPNSLETTGWVFSQKPPNAEASPEDNYLMLQNTQPSGSLNLVKSSFDPENPTQFDIILDPQNGHVKTTNSFDAPKVNFRKNATDTWSIFQPPAGDANENKLRIQNYQDNAGAVQILDDSNNIWADFNNLATSFNKPTFINNTLNVNGDTTLSSISSLLFGAYIFRPQQFYKDITGFSFNHSAIGATNLLFNTGNPAVAEWTNVNTGASNQAIDLINNPGAYKITIRQTSSGSEIAGMRIMSDIVLSRPNDNAPSVELAQPTAYSYTLYNSGSGGGTPGAPIITMVPGFLTWGVHCTFPQVSNNETANIRITLTQMPYFA